jgi:hypothetical protein
MKSLVVKKQIRTFETVIALGLFATVILFLGTQMVNDFFILPSVYPLKF